MFAVARRFMRKSLAILPFRIGSPTLCVENMLRPVHGKMNLHFRLRSVSLSENRMPVYRRAVRRGLCPLVAATPPLAQPVKLGELNSYKVFPAFLEPYKKGMELALDEVNAAGGVLGRRLEIVSRDDNGTPGDAVRVAEELIVAREGRAADGHVRLERGPRGRRPREAAQDSLSRRRAAHRQDRLGQRQQVHVPAAARRRSCRRRCSCPKRPSSSKKRWAIVYPNYEYGQSATAAFKKQMNVLQSGGLEFIEQRGAAGQDRSGPGRAGAARCASPTRSSPRCSGPISRASSAKGSCAACSRIGPCSTSLGGEPEYLDPLKDEAPVGWYVTGYPWYAIDTPEHKRFRDAYQAQVQRLSAPGLGGRLQRGRSRRRRRSERPDPPIREKLVAAL